MADGALERLGDLVDKLAAAGWKERDAIKEEILVLAQEADNRAATVELLEGRKRSILSLEVRWEIDEVLEALAPPPAPEPEPEEEAAENADPNRPLTAADLDVVYDDPRGLVLHRSKVGDRWFATQPDQQSGQPRTFELHETDVTRLKTQLKGSPYWVLGAGAAG
jgi:hypothetical protein